MNTLTPVCVVITAGFIVTCDYSVYLTWHTFPLSLSRQVKDSLKGATVPGQDRSSAAVQKRPVRPILPAYYTTGEIEHTAHSNQNKLSPCGFTSRLVFMFPGRTVFQILTVPSDKGKVQSANNNKSSAGTVHHLMWFVIALSLGTVLLFVQWLVLTNTDYLYCTERKWYVYTSDSLRFLLSADVVIFKPQCLERASQVSNPAL